MVSKVEKRNYYDNTLNYSVINKTENVQNIIDGVLNKTLTMFLYTNLPSTLPIEEIEKILQLNGTGFVTLIDDNLVILKGSYNYEKVDIYNRPVLNKTLTMFLYTNLPSTLPIEEIEKILQLNGTGFVTLIDDNLVILKGSYNYEKVDIYNRPLEINCYLPDKKTFKMFKISDGVILKNDYLERGLLPILKKWGYLINESELTLIIANKFKRMVKTFIANDDPTAESVKTYLKKVDAGETSLIVGNILFDSIKVDGETNSNTLHELIEYDNYIKSELYKELGLYSNDNMKKERLISSEVENGMNSIYPLVDN